VTLLLARAPARADLRSHCFTTVFQPFAEQRALGTRLQPNIYFCLRGLRCAYSRKVIFCHRGRHRLLSNLGRVHSLTLVSSPFAGTLGSCFTCLEFGTDNFPTCVMLIMCNMLCSSIARTFRYKVRVVKPRDPPAKSAPAQERRFPNRTQPPKRRSMHEVGWTWTVAADLAAPVAFLPNRGIVAGLLIKPFHQHCPDCCRHVIG